MEENKEMPTCQNCGHKWSWTKTWKLSLTLDHGMICPNCGKKQYVTNRTRKMNAVMTLVITTLMLLVNIIFGSAPVLFIVLIVVFLLYIGLYPLWLELSNEEETFW